MVNVSTYPAKTNGSRNLHEALGSCGHRLEPTDGEFGFGFPALTLDEGRDHDGVYRCTTLSSVCGKCLARMSASGEVVTPEEGNRWMLEGEIPVRLRVKHLGRPASKSSVQDGGLGSPELNAPQHEGVVASPSFPSACSPALSNRDLTERAFIQHSAALTRYATGILNDSHGPGESSG